MTMTMIQSREISFSIKNSHLREAEWAVNLVYTLPDAGWKILFRALGAEFISLSVDAPHYIIRRVSFRFITNNSEFHF